MTTESTLRTADRDKLEDLVARRTAELADLRSANERLRRELKDRELAEAALAERQASLSRRIEQRTAELSAANIELARVARLKDEFLATMSHELRTPLNAILGLSEALQEQVYGDLSEKQLQSLRTIEESGRHLLTLINDILELSRVESGRISLEVGPIWVEAVCKASLQFVNQEGQKKGLTVTSTFDRTVKVIQADQLRLKQILVNLLTNAVKFTPAGGAIGLEVKGDSENRSVHLTVWDTGIGLSEADMQRLFKPFVQVDSSLTRQYGGTGLGLALVYRLVEMHGGSVAVDSTVGQGSRFTVSLPWPSPEEQASSDSESPTGPAVAIPAPSRHRAGFDQPLVLLADDNEAGASTVADYLVAKGYRVTVARDGVETLDRAREARPDVVLLDIQMRVLGGLEVTRRMRADTDLATVPIVALTALAMRGDRERCLAAGMNEYLSKPVSLERLLEVIEAQRVRD